MPKYKVYSSQIVYHVLEVEAETEEQAEELAFNDDANWRWYDCGNWQIETIEEVKHEQTN
jgi:hypothetical protein